MAVRLYNKNGNIFQIPCKGLLYIIISSATVYLTIMSHLPFYFSEVALLLFGVGNGLGNQILLVSQDGVPNTELGVSTGGMLLSNQIGGALGATIVGIVFTSITLPVDPQHIFPLTLQQAYTNDIGETLLLLLSVSIITFILSFRLYLSKKDSVPIPSLVAIND